MFTKNCFDFKVVVNYMQKIYHKIQLIGVCMFVHACWCMRIGMCFGTCWFLCVCACNCVHVSVRLLIAHVVACVLERSFLVNVCMCLHVVACVHVGECMHVGVCNFVG